MKTMIATIAAAMLALNVAAYNNTGIDPDYCVKSINGKMVVEKNGSTITKEIRFKDGTYLEPNGTVLMTNGKKVTLKEGECVNESTVKNLSKHREDTWNKPAKKRTEKMTKPAKHGKKKAGKDRTDYDQDHNDVY